MVYDVLGNEIASLVDGELKKGSYKINFNSSGLPSGIYYYKIKSGYFEQTRKMAIIK